MVPKFPVPKVLLNSERDDAQMLERYSVLVLPLVRFSSYGHKSMLILEIAVLSSYPELNQIIFEALISCSAKVVPLLIGRDRPIDKICCQFQAPSCVDRFLSAMAQEFESGADKNLIGVKQGYADLELITANPTDVLSSSGPACRLGTGVNLTGNSSGSVPHLLEQIIVSQLGDLFFA